MSQEEDRIDMGAEAHTSFLQHLREIRQQAEKEFGAENIFSETEAQDVMIGVEYLLLLFASILKFKILQIYSIYFSIYRHVDFSELPMRLRRSRTKLRLKLGLGRRWLCLVY